jgi:hypothetical protein
MNVHGFNYIRQNEINIETPQVPKPGAFEFEMVVEKL